MAIYSIMQVWAVGREEIHCIQVHDMKYPIEALYFNGDIACSVTQGTGVKVSFCILDFKKGYDHVMQMTYVLSYCQSHATSCRFIIGTDS